jgi:hypothetical protein
MWGCSSSGHSSVGMSLRYAHLAPDQRREAVARLSEKPVLALTMRLKWEGFRQLAVTGALAVLSLSPSPPIANERCPGRLVGQLRYGIPEAIRRGFQ